MAHSIWATGVALMLFAVLCAAQPPEPLPLTSLPECKTAPEFLNYTWSGCVVPTIDLGGQMDAKAFTFKYGLPNNGSLRFYVRAVTGTVTMIVRAGQESITLDTSEGPASLKLDPRYDIPGFDFTLELFSTYGAPSRARLEISTIHPNLTASVQTRANLQELYDECCSAEHEGMYLLAGLPFPKPCERLKNWINANESDILGDVCQDAMNVCDQDGNLLHLYFRGHIRNFNRTRDGGWVANAAEAFNDACLDAPQPALARFVNLTHLELLQLELRWTVAQVVGVTASMPRLERLYLGLNSIQGQLDGSACKLLEDHPNLHALSFTNQGANEVRALPQSTPNNISGTLAACFLSGSLEVLNLVGNQLQGVEPIPLSAATASRMQALRLSHQVNPNTNAATMAGKGLPQGLQHLKDLTVLQMGFNSLGGDVGSLELSPLIQYLDVQDNSLTGRVPNLERYKNLTDLVLGDNPLLQGDLGQLGLSDMPHLRFLQAGNCSIGGDLDSVNWAMNSQLRVLELSSSAVTGAVPRTLAQLPYLRVIALSNNPGITSQQPFGDALGPSSQNLISFYDVRNCSIRDLPDGLANLFFFRNSTLINLARLSLPWAFDISLNKIRDELPPWLAVPVRDTLSPVVVANPDMWRDVWLGFRFATQQDSPLEGNMIGCPSRRVARADLAQAVGAQATFNQFNQWYDQNTLCYNGTEQVPVATYLQWLDEYGQDMPAPPPPSGRSRQSTSGAPSMAGSGSSGGINAGMLAGIVIGVVVGLALLAALAFVTVRYVLPKLRNRNKKTFNKFQDNEPPTAPNPFGPAGAYPNMNEFQMQVEMPAGDQPVRGPNSV